MSVRGLQANKPASNRQGIEAGLRGARAQGGLAKRMVANGAASGAAGTGGGKAQPPRPDSAMRHAPSVRCLLIDDSRFDRQRLVRIAEQTGLEASFTEASSLDTAIAALRGGDFDVILLDQTLPDGDGTTVAAMLKKHLGADAPPIIMVSGSQETAMPARAFASGCVDYISKDNLTIPGLEKAILNTVAKADPGQTRKNMPISEHNRALRSLAEDTALELRIPLSRMLRLINRAADNRSATAQELADLKTICHEMWSYLDIICNLDGEAQP